MMIRGPGKIAFALKPGFDFFLAVGLNNICIYRVDKDGYKSERIMGIKIKARYEGSTLKPIKEIGLKEGEEVEIVVEKSAVDEFHGMMKIPKEQADEIIEMEMWD